MERIELPSTLKRIEYNTFEDCKNLKSIWLPERLEYIGDWCFCGSGLEDIMIPKGVKSIGYGAFKDSTLKRIAIDIYCQATVKSAIDNNVIVQAVREATVPYGTRTITEDQFSGKNVYRVVIPKSVEKIEDRAFEGCKNLREVLFEEGSKLKVVGENAFNGCSSLRNIQLPDCVEEIGLDAFNSSGLESFVAPPSLRVLRQSAFQDCKNLKYVKLNEGLEVLGTDDHPDGNDWCGVFEGSAVECVELPSTLRRIESSTFV